MASPMLKNVGCNADFITKLLNKSMALMQRSSFFEDTVLHYWAGGHYFRNIAMDDDISQQEVSLGVVKLLIEQGKDLLALDSWGFTPLLEAANGSYHDDLPNLIVLDFLLERVEYSRAEKIEAMELAGAVILKNSRNVLQFPKAFDYWRKTLHLRRHMEVDESGLIEKPRLNLKKTQITEWVTSEELEDVIEHPDKFMIQSFLVRLRIFSSKKWGAINYLFSSDLLDDCFGKLQHQLKFVEIFDILWAILETLLNRSDLRENKDVQWKIGKVIKRLIEVLTYLDSYSPDLWTEEIIKTSLDFIASATQLICPILCHLIPFARIVSRLPQMLLKKYAMEKLSKMRDQRGRKLFLKNLFTISTPPSVSYFILDVILTQST